MLVMMRHDDGTRDKLILTRGDEVIEICLCKIEGKRARVGVNADRSWDIRRGELPPREERQLAGAGAG